MEITGKQRVEAGRDRVWAALNDPQVLKACIPGCESIEKESESDYKIVMLAAVGPIKARFNGKLAIKDSNPPIGYSLVFEGSGGAAGFGKGQACVTLSEEASDVTILDYTSSAQVSGKLAQVGSRLIDGVAKKLAGDFFARLNGQFAAPQAEAAAKEPSQAAAAPAAAASPAASAPAASAAGSGGAARAAAAPSAVRAAAAPAANGWKIATFVSLAVAAAALIYAFNVG